VTSPLAQPAGWLAANPPNSQGPEFGGSSPIGLVVTLLLLIAVVLLVRSMNGHLRKLPASFDDPEPEQDPAGTGRTAAAEKPAAGAENAAAASSETRAGTADQPTAGSAGQPTGEAAGQPPAGAVEQATGAEPERTNGSGPRG
jgi:hypothetical protein